MTTQVTNEGSNMSVYEVGKNIKQEFGLLESRYDPGGDGDHESCGSWAQTKEPEEIRRLFHRTVNRDIL